MPLLRMIHKDLLEFALICIGGLNYATIPNQPIYSFRNNRINSYTIMLPGKDCGPCDSPPASS